jgi:hypothetical protein
VARRGSSSSVPPRGFADVLGIALISAAVLLLVAL